MSSFTPKSGSTKRADGGITILGVTSTEEDRVTDLLSFAENTPRTLLHDRVTKAVSPVESGNLGTYQPLSAGNFSHFKKEQYIAKILGDEISGQSSTLLVGGHSDVSHKGPTQWTVDDRRYDINDWSFVSGVQEVGANAGTLMSYGADNEAQSDPYTVPAEFVFLSTGKTPDQKDYDKKT